MLKTAFAVPLLLFALPLFSQKYNTAAGLRLGGGIGITVQQRLWSHYTAEAQLQKGFLNGVSTFTALFEQHQRIFSKGTNFYIGLGAHTGSYRSAIKEEERRNLYGISGIAGMEFTFGRTIFSADIKPIVNLAGGSSVFDTQVGISLRYVFIKAPKKEHKWMFWKKRKNKTKADEEE